MHRQSALPASAELVERVDWLIRLRWVAILGVIVTIEGVRRSLHAGLAVRELYLTTGCLGAYNLAFFLLVRRLRGRAAQLEECRAAAFANVQISLDLLALAVLLHFSGGIENPFASYFVFHVIIASILLSRRATYAQVTLGLALMSAVSLSEYAGVLKHYPVVGFWGQGAYRDGTLVAARLFVLGTTLFLSAFMATGIAAHLRSREQETVLLSDDVARKAAMLEAAYEKLSGTDRTKSQYMRKVSHELRGPLGTIQTGLRAVLDGLTGEVSQRSRDVIARAERRAGELAQVTQDLLVLSRAREARLDAQMSDIGPAAIASAVVEEMKAAAEGAGVSLLAEISPDVGQVRGDATGLQQMVGNLVSNAIRYTPRQGWVFVRVTTASGTVRVEVEDTGIGIPEEEKERIFEEFYRAANAREHASDGTGLGLSIVKAVAEQHGGSVSVDSTVGKGTRFTVDLPLLSVSDCGTNRGVN